MAGLSKNWPREPVPGILAGHPRVGIVTIDDDANLGNRLQNFAMQEALRSLGWRPETVRNVPPPMSRRLMASRAWHAIVADGPVTVARRHLGLAVDKWRSPKAAPPMYAERRQSSITAFADRHLERSDALFTELPPSYWESRYAVVVVGSDQVWNHGFRHAQGLDFLTFVPEERRVAYAASFGVHDVPTFLRERYRAWLMGIPHLSVREERGAQIVAELTGRGVPVVLDPTLLLSRRHWQHFGTRPNGLTEVDDRYAVQFFLGPSSQAHESWVASLARSRGVRVVDLNDLDSREFADLGPREFVGAIGGADFVATDSFHAGVFSLLQHTPLVVRSREARDSRLHNLFKQHGIVSAPSSVAGLRTALAPDWARADALVDAEREASWQFLAQALLDANRG